MSPSESDVIARARKLTVRWREAAAIWRKGEHVNDAVRVIASGLEQCADELEAALVAGRQAPAPADQKKEESVANGPDAADANSGATAGKD